MSRNVARKAGMLAISLALLAVLVGVYISASPTPKAEAHGAALNPASRTYTCYAEDPQNPTNPACQAAIAAGGTQPLYDWFGVLRSDGAGRTVGFIPDGQLCSGGNPKYAAFDAPRTDWPATTLTSGAQFTFTYSAWVPHPGSFRFYVTNSTYDPTKPFAWSMLDSQPFLTYNPEPAVVNGVYTMVGTLPVRTGRQIIYSVWTRSDSTETFYGCSDVVFGTDGVYPTPTPLPTPTCKATVAITQTWPGGYQGTINVTSTTGYTLIPWVISWSVPSGVTLASGWNATVTQDSTTIIANAPNWDRSFAPNATKSIGFVMNGASSPPPGKVVLNGSPCS
jgi:predicted carbohydrate-binding protein with CBM5 and CBM33 domain